MSKKPLKPNDAWEPPPLDWRFYDDPYQGYADGWRKPRKKKKHGKNTLR